MATDSKEPDISRNSRYKETIDNFQRLNNQLPQSAVMSLAREVIQRVATGLQSDGASTIKPNSDEIDALSNALIGKNPDLAANLIDTRFQDGVSLHDLYLDWLASAARQLGVWWERDEITFAQVTIGTGRIYAIMRALSQDIAYPVYPDQKVGLFALVPGEEHVLGVRMAADLFREDGWTIDLQLTLDHEALVEHITKTQQLIVGLSAGGIHAIEGLLRLILAIRVAAPSTLIVVSGNIVNEAEDQLRLMEVDAIFSSLDEAKTWSDEIWENYRHR